MSACACASECIGLYCFYHPYNIRIVRNIYTYHCNTYDNDDENHDLLTTPRPLVLYAFIIISFGGLCSTPRCIHTYKLRCTHDAHRNNNLLDNGLKLHMPSIRTNNPRASTLVLDRFDPDNTHPFTHDSASKLPFRSAFSRFTCTTPDRVSFTIASKYIIILCSTRVRIIYVLTDE